MESSQSIALISRSAQLFRARQDALCADEYLGGHGAVSRDAELVSSPTRDVDAALPILDADFPISIFLRARQYALCAVASRPALRASVFVRSHAACSATFALWRVCDATRAPRGDANSFSRAPAGLTAALARGLSVGSLMRARRGVLR